MRTFRKKKIREKFSLKKWLSEILSKLPKLYFGRKLFRAKQLFSKLNWKVEGMSKFGILLTAFVFMLFIMFFVIKATKPPVHASNEDVMALLNDWNGKLVSITYLNFCLGMFIVWTSTFSRYRKKPQGRLLQSRGGL